jgi:hypothetical protein
MALMQRLPYFPHLSHSKLSLLCFSILLAMILAGRNALHILH